MPRTRGTKDRSPLPAPAREARTARSDLGGVQSLHRATGNQAIGGSLRGAGAHRLQLGDPRGRAEREAEQSEAAVSGRSAEPAAATTSPPQHAAGMADLPPSVEARVRGLQSGGAALPAQLQHSLAPRLPMNPDAVRIHTGPAAAASARALGARAFTVGRHVVFGDGQYSPSSPQGQRLIAHEVAHVAQQDGSGPVVQRSPDTKAPAPEIASYVWLGDAKQKRDRKYAEQRGQDISDRLRLSGTLTAELRAELNGMMDFFEDDAFDAYVARMKPALLDAVADKSIEIDQPGPTPIDPTAVARKRSAEPTYIDNNIKKVSFYTAELAIIEYRDGTKFELGLVPKWMKAPVVEVDYRTQGFQLHPAPSRTGFGFINDVELQDVPRGMAWGDVQKQFTHEVDYYVEAKTGRVIPSRINELTAPTLTRILRDSEAQFLANADFAAHFGIQMAKVVGFMGGGGNLRGAVAPVEAAASKMTTRVVMSRAAARLQAEFEQLLASGAGSARALTVEGVTFGAVRVAEESGVLTVARVSIKRLEGTVGGAGRAANAAFEDAAMALARARGLRTVTVNVGNIMNPAWKAYMESIGYVRTMRDTATGFENVWLKTITL